MHARPRFQPVMEIDNPRKGRLPTRFAMSRSSSIAFCFSAAGHGQTAMEMKMTLDGADGQEPVVKQHGARASLNSFEGFSCLVGSESSRACS